MLKGFFVRKRSLNQIPKLLIAGAIVSPILIFLHNFINNVCVFLSFVITHPAWVFIVLKKIIELSKKVHLKMAVISSAHPAVSLQFHIPLSSQSCCAATECRRMRVFKHSNWPGEQRNQSTYTKYNLPSLVYMWRPIFKYSIFPIFLP